MYRCCECGCKYSEKPDFCDCGNDTFVEEKETQPVIPAVKVNMSGKDILSWVIFIALILLSILVILFFPRVKVSENVVSQNEVKVENKKQQDIPSINSFWIDCKPQTLQEQVAERIQEIIPTPVKQEVKQKPNVVKQQTNIQVKPKQTSAPVKTVQKTQTQSAVKQTTYPKTGKAQPVQMTYEVANYRTALRQRLLSNLDIYTIVGSGTCGVEFAVDEEGKLINRGFTFQSDNKTVNDAVYKMLMRTPRFNQPPASLVNKKLKLVFKLDSESYEIRYAD